MANPTLLTSPIAENGDKNVIPATTGATTGLLDQEHGFQQINELPLQAGGLPPQRKDFNGAFNLLSKILFYTQKGWQFEFDELQDYYAGCIVKDTDGQLYEALNDVSASSTHPKDDTTNWALYDYATRNISILQSAGYYRARSGWLVQWGTVDCKIAGSTSITYPLTFANFPIIIGAPTWSQYSTYDIRAVFGTTTTGASAKTGNNVHLFGTKPSNDPNVVVSWIAIGK